MQSLEERLRLAMDFGQKSAADLARAARITPPAMSKLLNGKSKEIKASNLFVIARECSVDPEWLGTGRGKAPEPGGKAKRQPYSPLNDFQPKDIDMLRMFLRLPPEIRTSIRGLILTHAAALREGYTSWMREARELIDV